MSDRIATHALLKPEKEMQKEIIIQALKPYNLSKVAEEIGVHRQTLYRLVHEKTKPSPMLEKALIDFLGLEDQQDGA